jgi:15-cis-phytoene synthase
VERAHYQVLTQRVSVPLTRRLAVALPAARHTRTVRHAQERWVRVA